MTGGGSLGGLFGAALGLVILAEGVRLIRSSEKKAGLKFRYNPKGFDKGLKIRSPKYF